MASPIITALRQNRTLKESLLHTATELAHLASIYGTITVSYTRLADKSHCSRRTALRHIQRLLDLGIIRKTVTWIRGNYCERNQYAFLIHWQNQAPKPGSDTVASTSSIQQREKNSSLTEDIQRLKKGLTFCQPGTEAWNSTSEKLARLEALLVGGTVGH